jgi:uncharacterized DUF497 family protein
MIFTWDEAKNTSNKEKHGVSFEEAKSVFFDESARLIYDSESSDSEERFVLMGMSNNLNLPVVIHAYKENNEIIRVISARKATKTETNFYKR